MKDESTAVNDNQRWEEAGKEGGQWSSSPNRYFTKIVPVISISQLSMLRAKIILTVIILFQHNVKLLFLFLLNFTPGFFFK